MSDRLSELRRQRALAQEQVAWFDREIARESGGVQPPGPADATSSPTGPRPAADGGFFVRQAAPADTPPAGHSPEDLLRRYQGASGNVRSEVKRGCLIYFFAAFALLFLGTALFAFFWARSHDYPMPWSDRPPAANQP